VYWSINVIYFRTALFNTIIQYRQKKNVHPSQVGFSLYMKKFIPLDRVPMHLKQDENSSIARLARFSYLRELNFVCVNMQRARRPRTQATFSVSRAHTNRPSVLLYRVTLNNGNSNFKMWVSKVYSLCIYFNTHFKFISSTVLGKYRRSGKSLKSTLENKLLL
jgi:hypothetical protein